MYKINPGCFTGVTVLPSVIAEKHLLMASLIQLKTVIYIFGNPAAGITPETVAAAVGTDPGEASDALKYWKTVGILTDSDAPVQTAAVKEEKPAEKPVEKKVIEAKPTRYTQEMIVARINESEDVRTLFSEAQMKLGRTIGSSDQSSLLLLMDYYGLPLEIILTICEYATSHGKSNNINYIYTIGVDWSKREIDTIERADEELKRIESVSSSWRELCALTGISSSKPTVQQQKYLSVWLDEWHFPMSVVVLAFEETVKNTGGKNSFSYMNKVLSNWHQKGIKTPEDVADEQKSFIEKKEKLAAEKTKNSYNGTVKPKDTGAGASYDIERAANRAKTQVPELKKKEKR